MAKWNVDKLCRPKKYMGQIMAECDCQHQACDARGYCMADRIEELETKLTSAFRALERIELSTDTREQGAIAMAAIAKLKGGDRG